MGLKFALLTGAGFSKGYGGLLTSEMTSRIISSSRLDAAPQIREDLLSSNNYEDTLADYRNRQHSPSQEDVYCVLENMLTGAIDEAYDFQERLLETNPNLRSPAMDYLLDLMAKYRGQGCLWFTLNHDLLIEKRWKQLQVGNLVCPGIPSYIGATHRLPQTSEISEFEIEPVNLSSMELMYIKVHGSKNWYVPLGQAKRRVMIAGDRKREQIKDFPGSAGALLRYYLDTFESGIDSGTTVLCIGYSFLDPHINEVLAKPEVRLYIVNPCGFPKHVPGPRGIRNGIIRNLIGIWPLTYFEVFGGHGKAMIEDLSRRLEGR